MGGRNEDETAYTTSVFSRLDILSPFSIHTGVNRRIASGGMALDWNRNIKSICLSASLAAMMIAVTHAQNLIINGSFESPVVGGTGISNSLPAGWSDVFPYGHDYYVVNPAIYNAWISETVYLPATDGTQAAVLDDTAISQLVSLTSGQTYTLTFDFSAPVSSSLNLFLLYLKVQGNSQILNQTFTVAPSSSSWTHESYAFTSSESGLYDFWFYQQGVALVPAVLDNVVLQVVPEPGSAALLGFGTSVLAILNRRIRLRL